jgi:hypothetical protein
MALRGPKRGFAASRLLGLRVWIPPGKWISLSYGCCVLSGRGLCDGLITHLEESYRVCCVLWASLRSPVRGAMIRNRIEEPQEKNQMLLFVNMSHLQHWFWQKSLTKENWFCLLEHAIYTWLFCSHYYLQRTSLGIFHCYKLCSFGEGICCSFGFCLTLFHRPGSMNSQPLDARCSVEINFVDFGIRTSPCNFFMNL